MACTLAQFRTMKNAAKRSLRNGEHWTCAQRAAYDAAPECVKAVPALHAEMAWQATLAARD